MLVETTIRKVLHTEIMELCGFSETASKKILEIIDKRDKRAMGEWHSGSTDTEFRPDSIKRYYTEISDIYTLTQSIFVNKKIKKDLSFETYMYLIQKYTYIEPYLCDDNKTIICNVYNNNLTDNFRDKPLED